MKVAHQERNIVGLKEQLANLQKAIYKISTTKSSSGFGSKLSSENIDTDVHPPNKASNKIYTALLVLIMIINQGKSFYHHNGFKPYHVLCGSTDGEGS